MKIVDANVLIYAVNLDTAHHDASRRWLDAALSGADRVGFAWVVLLAFVRLTTRTGLFPTPLPVSDATSQVEDWLSSPSAVVVEPTPRHAAVLSDLLGEVGTGGNLVTDAHLAALAREHRADIVTYDRDFTRYPGVRSATPDTLLMPGPRRGRPRGSSAPS